MWHASVAPASTVRYGREALRELARRALAGVGDAALGEWEEWGGYAFHVRRRLHVREVPYVGPVVDVRGTLDGQRRCARMRRDVPAAMWAEECGDPRESNRDNSAILPRRARGHP